MAVTQEQNASLKRNLKPGKQYEKLIPAVSCASTDLGQGDTFHTVDEMRDWIIKYAWQTKELAALLYSQDLRLLAHNIYKFSYDHIQYNADGALQQISSPACTWHKRKEGVDCKSFSVFASSILSNLGIKHAIRQVRQPYFNPEHWTHVYVVIYQDQNPESYSKNAPTFVIDATRHHNQEVNYLEKHDLMMLQHVGLNAPSNVLSAEKQNIIDNFNKFCLFLLENNVPVATVNAIRSEVNKYTSQGVDPQFAIIDNGISIQGKEFTFTLVSDPEYQRGLGIVVTGTAAVAAGKALMNMLPQDFFGNTFGAIFANGFDLSCWNASYSESKAQSALQTDIPFFINDHAGLDKAVNTTTVNKFMNAIDAYIADSKNGQASKYASCTRKGYAARQKGAEEAKQRVLQTLESSGLTLVPTGKKEGFLQTEKPMPSIGKPYTWGAEFGSKYAYQYDSYRVEGGNQSSTPNYDDVVTTDQDLNMGGNTNPGSNYQNGGNNQVPIGNTNQGASQAGMGWLAPVAIAAISIPMVMKQMKQGNATTKTKK
ncbi:hypothetical protein SAMN04487907_101257 [Zunongwangia mangrovi]|uniref:Transglutaminase-like superfamily protein n=1 Tax=Zunongwangia mangrovi TaxID=1334022 RepID=A0A1I1DHG7_9FLAO|nr:hypothetical protein [Zunongwangia mangrovi]SFB72190.1 hypothetical protein SAMN04487907_101257 [Zunongwangia mangrovi]